MASHCWWGLYVLPSSLLSFPNTVLVRSVPGMFAELSWCPSQSSGSRPDRRIKGWGQITPPPPCTTFSLNRNAFKMNIKGNFKSEK
jgi:hypothetical protein